MITEKKYNYVYEIVYPTQSLKKRPKRTSKLSTITD